MKVRKLSPVVLVAALLISGLVGQGAQASSTLNRADGPVVVSGAQVGSLQDISPGDLVGFRWNASAWEQIPIQVDERHLTNIRNAYPAGNLSPCGDPCYQPGTRVVNSLVYSDDKTLIGADPDPVLDADDEIALMVKDTGGQAPAATGDPAGVLGSGVEIQATDPIDGGSGFVYLFERDPQAASPLDPSAGKSYVEYVWQVVHIGDAASTAANYKTQYRFNGHNGTAYVGNPEDSWVQTAHYRRGMTARWHDNELRNFRGGASGEDILDRHDASLVYDAQGSCIRTQATFDVGEMAYITSKGGPIRAIRDYLGTNSGPLVQRRHIFYESHEEIRIDLRVHVIPGPQELWDYNANAVGLEYTNNFWPVGARIDGIPDAHPGTPLISNNSYIWETVDSSAVAVPGDPAAQGGLTFTVYYNTNNVDTTWRAIYRDAGVIGPTNYCNGEGTGLNSERAKLYGSHATQTGAVMGNTDPPTTAFMTTTRTLHYEAPGTADGPKRLQQVTTPLQISSTDS